MLWYKIIRVSNLSEDDIGNTFNLLSQEQKNHISALCEKRKIQSLAVRAALNLLISENQLDVSVSSLSFDKSNKPYFINSNIYLSFSHSDEFVACAVSDTPVGIDIEKIKPVKDSVVSRVCDLEEKNYISNNGLTSFFTIWTLKEAHIKANGFSQMSNISTVKNDNISVSPDEFLTGEISNYKWSIIKKQR